MDKISILLPYDEVSEAELKEVEAMVKDTSISFDEDKNLTGEMLCLITSTVMMIPGCIVALLTLSGGILANKKVTVIGDDGEPVKTNIRLKDVEKYLQEMNERSQNDK